MTNDKRSVEIDWLIDCLDRFRAVDREVQLAAATELRDFDRTRLISLLDQLLTAPRPELRAEAAGWLAMVAAPEIAVPQLLSVLSDPDATVRGVVCALLQDLNNPQAVPKLLRIVSSDPAPDVRINAVWTLAKIGGSECLPVLETTSCNDAAVDSDGRKVSTAAKDAIEAILNRTRPAQS